MIPDAAWFGLAISAVGGALAVGTACVKLVWGAARTMTTMDARLLAIADHDVEVLRRITQLEDTLSIHISKTRSDIADLRERTASTEATVRWSRPDTG